MSDTKYPLCEAAGLARFHMRHNVWILAPDVEAYLEKQEEERMYAEIKYPEPAPPWAFKPEDFEHCQIRPLRFSLEVLSLKDAAMINITPLKAADTAESLLRDLVAKCEGTKYDPNSFTRFDLSEIYDRARELLGKPTPDWSGPTHEEIARAMRPGMGADE